MSENLHASDTFMIRQNCGTRENYNYKRVNDHANRKTGIILMMEFV